MHTRQKSAQRQSACNKNAGFTQHLSVPYTKNAERIGHSSPRGIQHPVVSKDAGFTVLELLISVGIIAMLAAITMVLLTGVKERNRDAKRMQDIYQLQNALSLYYTNHSQFPTAATPITITGTDAFSIALEDDGAIPETPIDPQHPTRVYTYQSASGSTFTITFCLETDTIAGHAIGCGNTATP